LLLKISLLPLPLLVADLLKAIIVLGVVLLLGTNLLTEAACDEAGDEGATCAEAVAGSRATY
jgi:hypothetical protein